MNWSILKVCGVIEMDNGWIKLYRCLLDNPIVCKDGDYLSVWVFLLLNAAHTEHDVTFAGKRYTLKSGELTTGRKVISSQLHMSESKVQRILKTFENEHQIEQRTDRQCRLISIVNWDEYQSDEQRNEQRVNNDRTTTEQRVNTKQECKNEKNEKNEKKSNKAKGRYDGIPLELIESMKGFEEMRKLIKKPLTDRAFNMIITKAEKLSCGDMEKAARIIDQSTEHSWQGVFELMEEKNAKNNSTSKDTGKYTGEKENFDQYLSR